MDGFLLHNKMFCLCFILFCFHLSNLCDCPWCVCPACRLLCDVRRSQHIPRRVGAAGGQAQAALHLGAQDTPGCRWVGGHGGSEQRLISNTIIKWNSVLECVEQSPVSASRSQASRRVRGMMMSGKQFSLDSRIDLAEAVGEAGAEAVPAQEGAEQGGSSSSRDK